MTDVYVPTTAVSLKCHKTFNLYKGNPMKLKELVDIMSSQSEVKHGGAVGIPDVFFF